MQLEATLGALAGSAFSARAVSDGESWSELVWAEEAVGRRPGQLVRVELLTTRGRRQDLGGAHQDSLRFDDLSGEQVTPFLVLTVEQDGQSVSGCVRATMVEDVPHRLDHVLLGQVDTAEKFLRWLLMLLADDPGADFLTSSDGQQSAGSWFARAQEQGLFEAMVTSLAERPEQLELVERFVTRVAEETNRQQVLPDEFLELWQVVREALDDGSAA